MDDAVKVVRLEEFDAVPGPGSLTWLPVRHALGIRAFGCNAYVAANAGEDVVEPHTETHPGDDPTAAHEELYFVARGHARFQIDGTEHDAPEGTYVFIADPGAHRHAVAVQAGTTVLSFGGPPTFSPSAWEWRFRAGALAADPATRSQAREILEQARERFPDDDSVRYDLACVAALAGDASAALHHLRAAIDADPENARQARADEDFASLHGDERFAELTREA